MRALVIGSGAREHALVLALARDPDVFDVHVAPGNPGCSEVAARHDVDVRDGAAVAGLARRLDVDLVVVGPEAPLVAGVADTLRAAGFACFGPSREAARLEGSKAFAKQLMAEAGVPTARARVCETRAEAEAALDELGPPYVVKDDGLAGGKGVVVTDQRELAAAHAGGLLRVVIEEFLDGPEVSLFGLCDGRTVLPMLAAQDFKRAGDDNTGPNTGGMGAYAPLPWLPSGFAEDVSARVLQPSVDAMAERGTPFSGLLYAGLAMTSRGLRVVEFNARFGDPETQVLLPLLRTPLGGVLHAAATGRLAEVGPLSWGDGASVCVVVAAAGYPSAPRAGDTVAGLDDAALVPGVDVLHAGTAERDGRLVTAGGRVLAVTAHGDDLGRARERAYEATGRVRIDGAHWRTDIALAAAAGASWPPD